MDQETFTYSDIAEALLTVNLHNAELASRFGEALRQARLRNQQKQWTWFDFGGCQMEGYSMELHKSLCYADGSLGIDEHDQRCVIVWRRLSFATDVLYMRCQFSGNWEKEC